MTRTLGQANKRKYEETHPWLRFEVNLQPAPPELWLLLGEAKSKIEHLAGIPLPPAVHEEFNQIYLAKGVLATTAIEGNTLSEEEVLAHLRGERLPPSKEYLAREVQNIVDAVNLIWRDNTGEWASLCPDLITKFNTMVLDGLQLDDGVVPGEISRAPVGVLRYRGAPREDCEYLLARLCDWLNGEHFKAKVETSLGTAILRAVLAHLYLAWIHPFGDGNGRTARLIEFQILVHAGVPMPSAHLLSNHYNATRAEYYRQLDRAHQSGGEVAPFLIYAVRGFVEGLREQIERIKNTHWLTAWREYVFEQFENDNSPTAKRRRALVLALSVTQPVPRAKLTMLTPEVAAAYASKTTKTLTRDLNELQRRKLIKQHPEGFRANTGLMMAFQPIRKAIQKPKRD
jgi:Fic family protein